MIYCLLNDSEKKFKALQTKLRINTCSMKHPVVYSEVTAKRKSLVSHISWVNINSIYTSLKCYLSRSFLFIHVRELSQKVFTQQNSESFSLGSYWSVQAKKFAKFVNVRTETVFYIFLSFIYINPLIKSFCADQNKRQSGFHISLETSASLEKPVQT